MSKFASADYTHGQTNAIIKKLIAQGGPDGPIKFLRGELVVKHNWREENNVIYFSVTSDGTTGPQWIERLYGKNLRISGYAERVLEKAGFKPTKGVTTEVAVLKGLCFSDDGRTIENIRTQAVNRALETPSAEIACLIRDKFVGEEIEGMGLKRIIVMHKPIKSQDDFHLLLSADTSDGFWLGTHIINPDLILPHPQVGFAFVVSKVNTQK